jgi:hypothetical protein
MNKMPWDDLADKPTCVTITVAFSQDEYDRLKALADRRGISVATALRYMAANANNAPPTIYGGTVLG